MATGGAADEELCSFELFECSVCLESLINRQPRLLTCGHTSVLLVYKNCLQETGSTVLNVGHLRGLDQGVLKLWLRTLTFVK